jgi:hypothetical protein
MDFNLAKNDWRQPPAFLILFILQGSVDSTTGFRRPCPPKKIREFAIDNLQKDIRRIIKWQATT